MKARPRLGKWLNRTWSHWRPSPTIVPSTSEPARRAGAVRDHDQRTGGFWYSTMSVSRPAPSTSRRRTDHVDDRHFNAYASSASQRGTGTGPVRRSVGISGSANGWPPMTNVVVAPAPVRVESRKSGRRCISMNEPGRAGTSRHRSGPGRRVPERCGSTSPKNDRPLRRSSASTSTGAVASSATPRRSAWSPGRRVVVVCLTARSRYRRGQVGPSRPATSLVRRRLASRTAYSWSTIAERRVRPGRDMTQVPFSGEEVADMMLSRRCVAGACAPPRWPFVTGAPVPA